MKHLYMFWCNTRNYGDEVGPYLVKKLTGMEPVYLDPRKRTWWNRIWRQRRSEKILLTVGSIIDCSDSDSVVWGSGIMARTELVAGGDIRAVRGPRTRERLLELGLKCPNIFGDPALLLPLVFPLPPPAAGGPIGIIPHKLDYEAVQSAFGANSNFRIINLTGQVEPVTREIQTCRAILSTSLHGLIVAQAYGIPANWFKVGSIGGDDIKFDDYFSAVGIASYTPLRMDDIPRDDPHALDALLVENSQRASIEAPLLETIQIQLLRSAPFKLSQDAQRTLDGLADRAFSQIHPTGAPA